MYRITIKTKYNNIVWDVEDYNTPEVIEVLEQPYILEVKIENIKQKQLRRKK